MKYAFVTGASSGIGHNLCFQLLKHHFTVFAGARNVAKMADLASAGAIVVDLDVTSQDSVKAATELVKQHTDRLDFLFNNAGTHCILPGTDLTIENVHAVMDVNFYGVIRMTNALIPLLIAARGTIVQTGSVSSYTPLLFASAYSASKAALLSYTNILRIELRPFSVKVVVVDTGAVDTGFSDRRGLPENSLYKGAEETLTIRQNFTHTQNHLNAPEYAKKVVDRITGGRAPENFLEGGSLWRLALAKYVLPLWVVEATIVKLFKFDAFIRKVQARH